MTEGMTDSVFMDQIPPGAPVLVVLVEQEGCPACEDFHPLFVKEATPFARRGLPIIRVNAAATDPVSQNFMETHGVQFTPTVLVVTYWRGPLARIDGASTAVEVQRLLNVAWAHNRPRTF